MKYETIKAFLNEIIALIDTQTDIWHSSKYDTRIGVIVRYGHLSLAGSLGKDENIMDLINEGTNLFELKPCDVTKIELYNRVLVPYKGVFEDDLFCEVQR